jgi:uncharacterized protein DUF1579
MVRRLVYTLVLACSAIDASPQGAPQKIDRFAPLRFMIGSWRGEQSGQPGRGTVERNYAMVLAGRFIQETNTSTYPNEVHHHTSMISYDEARKRFVFRQFHQEGFVNTYVQEPGGDGKTIVFVSEAIENIPPGWRARETYTIVSHDEFTERFDLAEPGRDFALYSEAHLKRLP